jgi:hypothetical protein
MAAWGNYTGKWFAPFDQRIPAPPRPPAPIPAQRRFRPTASPVPPPEDGVGIAPGTLVLASVVAVVLTILVAAVLGGWPVFRQWRSGLVLGNELAGYVRADDGNGLGARVLDHQPAGTTGRVSGAFRDPTGNRPPLAIAAGRALLVRPEAVARETMAGLPRHDDPIEVRSGALDGYVQCALVHDEPSGAFCVWADHGTTGLAFFPGRSVPEAAKLFGDIRQQMTVR